MTNGVPEVQIFQSYLHRNNGLFFLLTTVFIYLFVVPPYEVYRGYIVFAISVIVFVCPMFFCLSVNFSSVKDFSATT